MAEKMKMETRESTKKSRTRRRSKLPKAMGPSRSAGKDAAAEKALKTLFTNMLKEEAAEKKPVGPLGKVKREERDRDGSEGRIFQTESLSWARLASFAIYKLFHQWQIEGDFYFPLDNTAPAAPQDPRAAREAAAEAAVITALHRQLGPV